MTPQARAFLALFVIPTVVIVDQWTKYLVLNEPRFRALECLDGTIRCGGIEISQIFDLRMLWNRGMSFGMLQSDGIMRWVLVVVTLAIAIGFSIWLARAGRKLTAFALALVVGGAIGNVIDTQADYPDTVVASALWHFEPTMQAALAAVSD
ncbi:MAG: signal peptidase II, partial [Pseudomonadota bacterium]